MPVITLDAPTRGINAYDSPEDMNPADAIALDNWICRSGYLESRPLFDTYWLSTNGPTERFQKLTVYHGLDGDIHLAFMNTGEVFDLTNDSEGDPAIDSGFSTTPYDICTFHINDVLVIVSGDVDEQSFDGSTFTVLDYTGSSPSIPTGGAFTYGCNFKGRAMYINEEDCSFWYAAAGSYQGALVEFPLSSVAQHGGVPKHIATWTMDTGVGPDDTFVIYMTSGEVLLYQGDDPGDVDNWEIIGRFPLASPTTKHASVQVGSDLILLSETGYINLTDAMRSDQKSDYPKYSLRVSPMLEELSTTYASQGYTFDNSNMAIVWAGLVIFNWHMDDGSNERTYQFVLNIATGAWSRWTDLLATSWSVYQNTLYYTRVHVHDGLPDGSPDQASTMYLSAIPAFTNLGMPDAKKQLTAVQLDTTFPDIEKIEFTGYSDFNFEGSLPTPAEAAVVASPTLTNLGVFPSVRLSMLQTTKRGWHNLHAVGFFVSMAVQMRTGQANKVYWRSTSYRYRRAGAQ